MGRMGDSPRQPARLTDGEALALLASVQLGRVKFTRRALPAIQPVGHTVDRGQVIIGTDNAADIVDVPPRARTGVVAYQADRLNIADGTGWSVTIVGGAGLITDPAEISRYRKLLPPWAPGQAEHVIRIRPDMVSGFRLPASPEMVT